MVPMLLLAPRAIAIPKLLYPCDAAKWHFFKKMPPSMIFARTALE